MNTLLTLSIFIGLALLSAMLTLFAVAFYESVQRARRIRPDMRGKSFWQVARALLRPA
jgi:type II secretory pathway component PulJ